MVQCQSTCSLNIIFSVRKQYNDNFVRFLNVYVNYIFEFPTVRDETAQCEGTWIYKILLHIIFTSLPSTSLL